MPDPILFWNDVALEANKVSHSNGKNEQTGPTLSSRALAIIHLAMYDAYSGVLGFPVGLPKYNSNLNPPVLQPGSDVDENAAVAVAAAAHATLSHLFPSQKAFFDAKHLEAGLSGTKTLQGHQFGLLVAQQIIKDRKDDPSSSDNGYSFSTERGRHRIDPDNPQGFHAPFYGAGSKGFAISARHELDDPPFDNSEYRQSLRQVRRRGIAKHLMGTLPTGSEKRTVDQTVIGIYWGYDGANGLGTPPRLYNQIVRKVAIARNNTVADNASLFALVNVAMGDSGILAWDQKYIHDLWRPVVGIREHDVSMGPQGTPNNNINNESDTEWLPLGAPATNSDGKNFTPPFPAYPSGHATFGAAALHITRLFYAKKDGIDLTGDTNPDNFFDGLSFVSDEYNGVNKDNTGTVRPKHNRDFPEGLWQMIVENGLSRIYLGVHWSFDAFALDNNGDPDLSRNIGGVPLGLKIAEDIFSNGMTKSNVPPRS